MVQKEKIGVEERKGSTTLSPFPHFDGPEGRKIGVEEKTGSGAKSAETAAEQLQDPTRDAAEFNMEAQPGSGARSAEMRARV